MFTIRIILTLNLLLLFSFLTFPQVETREQLAIQYYQNEEFDKAFTLFEELFKEDQASTYYYSYYINCIIKLNELKIAEKELKNLTKKYPNIPEYQVDQGYIYSLMNNEKKKIAIYENVLKELPRDESLISKTGNAFYNRNEPYYAIKTYLKGRRILVNSIAFDFTLADLYLEIEDIDNMLLEYLDILKRDPTKLEVIQDNLQDLVIQDIYYKKLKELLIKKIQLSAYNQSYVNLLSWLFIQKKDFSEAFKQLRALDKRFKKGNNKLIQLAGVCISNKAYDVAVDVYQYIIDKGYREPYYLHAKFGILDVKYQKIKTFEQVDIGEIKALESEYTEFLSTNFFQYKEISEKLILRLSEIKAIYLGNVSGAINFMNQYINNRYLTKATIAKLKLNLGDYYILYGDIWEATLLYSQVDKMFRGHPIGHEAKFRNATLSFFRGEFGWASDQLDVLKASTTELIANDALQLSLLIQDNLGLDTTEIPLRMYAKADFFVFKNEFDSANIIFDSIIVKFPNHTLTDEIYLSKGKMLSKRGKFKEAIVYYEKIFDEYSYDILADDAIFSAAKLYEERLNMPDKATELYEKIIFNYGESVFVVEARKRYRKLNREIEN